MGKTCFAALFCGMLPIYFVSTLAGHVMGEEAFAPDGAGKSGQNVVLHLSFDKRENPLENSGLPDIKCKMDGPDESKPRWVENGKTGGALEFDGKDDKVIIESSPALSFGPDDSFSIEMWVKSSNDKADPYETIMSSGNYQTPSNWKFILASRGRLGFIGYLKSEKKNNIQLLSPKNSVGEWHRLVLVRDVRESMLRFYYDDELVREMQDISSGDQFAPGTPIVIGMDSSGGGKPFKGQIDEITIAKGAGKANGGAVIQASSAYSPLIPKEENPDPELAAGWLELKKNGLAIVPCPKKIKVEGNPLSIGSDWVFFSTSEGMDAGLGEINKKLKGTGGKELSSGEISGKHAIIVGTFDDAGEFLDKMGKLERPPRQGYVIRSYREGGLERVAIIGADRNGALYGCVTLSMMIGKGAALTRASIDDWPDYKSRMGFRVFNSDVEKAKESLDQSFRAKMDLVYGPGFSDSFEALVKEADKYKAINEYARQRGIRVVYGGWFSVGAAPFPKDSGFSQYYYPYNSEEGLVGHRGMAFSWCRDDLIKAKGQLFGDFMAKTGADAFFLHPMDTGGRDNPENWTYRTPMDKERFGDDRASADFNLYNGIYKEMKAQNPNVMFCPVVYPYSPTQLAYPEVREWLKKLSEMLPEELYFCLREGSRENIERWRVSNRQGRLNYYETCPFSYRMAFTTAGRYAATFLFDDKDIYWFQCSGNGRPYSWPEIWAGSEYAWNTKAPGWGWLPSDCRSIRQIDSSPKVIIVELLPRICEILFGRDTATLSAQALSGNLSFNIAADFSQFNGADPEAYFGSKYRFAESAVELLKQAETGVRADSKPEFAAIKSFVEAARYLLEARYRYYLSRRHIAEDRFDEAQEEVNQALSALRHVSGTYSKEAETIKKDLGIASQVKWRVERKAFLKGLPAEAARIGVYNQGTYQGLLDGLNGVPGFKVSLIEDPTKAALGNYDIVIFSACRDMGDTSEDWRENLRAFVNNGGSVLFSHNAIGRYPQSAFGKPVFPEICKGYAGQLVNDSGMTAAMEHPASGTLKKDSVVNHEYTDHFFLTPGESGESILKDSAGNVVMTAGAYGKGRVVYTGEIFGLDAKNVSREPVGDEWKLLYNMLHWLKTGK